MPEQMDDRLSHKPVVVGVTGGPGSGKSSVTRILATLGAQTADADALVRWCYAEPRFVDVVARRFGCRALDENGAINRRALAEIVFQDEDALADLEAMVHPAVLHQMTEMVETYRHDPERAPMLALEVPLLYETGAEGLVDRVIVARARPDEIHRRLRERGWTEERIATVERLQMAPEEKAARADEVVNTDGTVAQTTALVERLFNRLTRSGF